MRPTLSIAHLAPLFLAVLVGCGGGGSAPAPAVPPPPAPASAAKATAISYVDPTDAGWRLVRNALESTDKRLVLNLVGPKGLKVWGVGLSLRAGAGVSYAKFDDGGYLYDEGVLKLSTNDNDPKLMVGGVKKGLLMVGMFQKGGPYDGSYDARAVASQDFGQDAGQSLLRVALSLPDDAASVGTVVALQVVKARVMTSKVDLVPADIQVGTLTLK